MTCGVRFGKCEDLLKLDGVCCPASYGSIDGRRMIYRKIEEIQYDACLEYDHLDQGNRPEKRLAALPHLFCQTLPAQRSTAEAD